MAFDVTLLSCVVVMATCFALRSLSHKLPGGGQPFFVHVCANVALHRSFFPFSFFSFPFFQCFIAHLSEMTAAFDCGSRVLDTSTPNTLLLPNKTCTSKNNLSNFSKITHGTRTQSAITLKMTNTVLASKVIKMLYRRTGHETQKTSRSKS